MLTLPSNGEPFTGGAGDCIWDLQALANLSPTRSRLPLPLMRRRTRLALIRASALTVLQGPLDVTSLFAHGMEVSIEGRHEEQRFRNRGCAAGETLWAKGVGAGWGRERQAADEGHRTTIGERAILSPTPLPGMAVGNQNSLSISAIENRSWKMEHLE